MNNFTSPPSEDESKIKIPKKLESLTTTMFQSLFPPISPQTTPLSSIRRVMLLNREIPKDGDGGSYILNLRHYAITTKATGLSRPLRRLNAAEKLMKSQKTKGKKGGLPNLGKLDDIADYMVGGADGSGYMTDATSGSEADTDAEVEVVETRAKKILSKRQKDREDGKGKSSGAGVEKRAVKLVELGPRMRLRMTKVEDGVCTGKVMWHEYIHKTKEEVDAIDKAWEKKRQEKEARKRIQKENVEKKRKAKGLGSKDAEGEDDDEMDVDEWVSGHLFLDSIFKSKWISRPVYPLFRKSHAAAPDCPIVSVKKPY
jgi:ribosome biogenesis protein SSF1/2